MPFSCGRLLVHKTNKVFQQTATKTNLTVPSMLAPGGIVSGLWAYVLTSRMQEKEGIQVEQWL